MTNFIKKFTILIIFWCLSLHAVWDPYALDQRNLNSGVVLSNPEYLALKAHVIEELRGSWCSEEKANLIMDLILLIRPKVCVEIGVFTGSSILPIAMALRYLNSGVVFGVDSWNNQQATKYLVDNDPNKTWWSCVDMKAAHGRFQDLIKTWSLQNVCIEINKPSHKAIYEISNEIDFLHFDGDYSEITSLQDVESYLPKVKSGGYILLSNLFVMVNGKQPKLQAFIALCKLCEIVASIDADNAVLFKRINK